jgi:hypothetical protein
MLSSGFVEPLSGRRIAVGDGDLRWHARGGGAVDRPSLAPRFATEAGE